MKRNHLFPIATVITLALLLLITALSTKVRENGGDKEREKLQPVTSSFMPSSEPVNRHTISVDQMAGAGDDGTVEYPNHSVQIIDANGQPLSNCSTYFWQSNQTILQLTTNNQGWVSLPIETTWDGLAIFPEGHLPVIRRISSRGIQQRVSLERGLSLTGRVEMINSNSTRPAGLSIRFRTTLPTLGAPAGITSLPQMSSVNLALDPSGGFELRGIPKKWEGSIKIPENLLISSYNGASAYDWRKRQLTVRPGRGLLIRLTQGVGLEGRVVDPSGEAGVGGIEVGASIDVPDRQESFLLGGTISDEAGQFYIPILPKNDEELELWVRGKSLPQLGNALITLGGTRKYLGNSFSIDLSLPQLLHSLGDLPLKTGVNTQIVVHDQEGNPIRDAFVSRNGHTETSDEFGVLRILTESVNGTAIVYAAGYYPFELVDIIRGQESMTITLQQAPSLSCFLQHQDAVPPEGLMLHLSSDWAFLPPALQASDFNRHRSFFTLPLLQGNQTLDGRFHLRVPIKGNMESIRLWGFMPDILISCQLEGPTGSVLGVADDLVFFPQENKTVEIFSSSLLGTLSGVVVDSIGTPIPNVSIQLNTQNGPAWLTTIRDGSFRCDGLPITPLEIVATKRGFAPFRANNILPSLEVSPLMIELEEPRTLNVFFVDEYGHDVPGGVVAYTGGFMDRTIGNGQRITDMPQSEFELRWRAGGIDGKSLIPPKQDEYYIELPAMGTLQVTLSRDDSTALQSCALILEATNSDVPKGFISRFGISFLPGEAVTTLSFQAIVTGSFNAYLEYGELMPRERKSLGAILIKEGEHLDLFSDLPN